MRTLLDSENRERRSVLKVQVSILEHAGTKLERKEEEMSEQKVDEKFWTFFVSQLIDLLYLLAAAAIVVFAGSLAFSADAKVIEFTDPERCLPCRMIIPIVEKLQVDYPIEVVDVGETPQAISDYQIDVLPTFIRLSEDGTESERLEGKPSESSLRGFCNRIAQRNHTVASRMTHSVARCPKCGGEGFWSRDIFGNPVFIHRSSAWNGFRLGGGLGVSVPMSPSPEINLGTPAPPPIEVPARTQTEATNEQIQSSVDRWMKTNAASLKGAAGKNGKDGTATVNLKVNDKLLKTSPPLKNNQKWTVPVEEIVKPPVSNTKKVVPIKK